MNGDRTQTKATVTGRTVRRLNTSIELELGRIERLALEGLTDGDDTQALKRLLAEILKAQRNASLACRDIEDICAGAASRSGQEDDDG